MLLALWGCAVGFAQVSQDSGAADFVELRGHIPSLVVDTPYATKDNFLKTAVYPENTAFLRRAVADRLALVQSDLRQNGYGLKVLDGYRPLSVQRAMWSLRPDPRYVANPASGSKHNRGAAVDVTLVNEVGTELLMPTRFDDFSAAAHVNSRAPSVAAKRHREILQEAMKRRGFVPMATEWWHFDDPDWKNYDVVDVSFAEIRRMQEYAATAIPTAPSPESAVTKEKAILERRIGELESELGVLRARLVELDTKPASAHPKPPVELKAQTFGR